MALAWALSTMKGEAAPEIEPIYIRTRALAEQLGDRDWLFWSMGGLYGVALAQGKVEAARQLTEQLMDLAQLAEEGQKSRFPDVGLLLVWQYSVLVWRAGHCPNAS